MDVFGVARQAWLGWLLVGSRKDITASMARIDVSVLVMSGEGDTAIPTAAIEADLRLRLADAMLSVIAGAGHLLPIEAVAETTRPIPHAYETFNRRVGMDDLTPGFHPAA